jgi:serine phosphatase RsbU (regulator of sigma subunit)
MTPGAAADQERPVRLGTLLRHVPLGVLVVDEERHVRAWNRAGSTLLELQPGDRGRPVRDLLEPPEVVDDLVAQTWKARTDEASGKVSVHTTSGRPVDLTATWSRTEDAEPVVLLMLEDASSRLRVEAERDRYSGHVSLLGRVSDALLGAHDPDQALHALGAELVDSFATWASFQAYDARGATARVLIEHRDPARAEDAAAAMEMLPEAVTEETPSRRIAAGGRAMLIPEVTEELLRSTTRDEETRVLLRRMGAASAIVVPLLGSRGVLGSIAVFRGPGEPAYTGAELDVATEVGRRTGAAFEVLEANRRQRALAEELQRSMLTEPPVLPDVEIEARYVPAADEAQVGGDWYDSFVRRDGSVLLTVGDVVGHDFEAAAVMGQLRGVLRGIGFGQVGGPAEVLGGLDSAMDALYPGVTATAVVGTLTRRGPDSVLRWSSAGHPPPVVIRADGTADATDLDSADLLLGVVPGVERREHEVVLRGGDTVLFFSDGLIERRGSDLDEGLVRLVGSTRELVGLHLAVLSDQVLLRQMGAEQEDDICLIAVRVHD